MVFSEISQNSQENTCARVSFLIKLQAACIFIKKRLWHRCFPVSFAKLLRTPFLTEHLQWLLLKCILLWRNLKKISKISLFTDYITKWFDVADTVRQLLVPFLENEDQKKWAPGGVKGGRRQRVSVTDMSPGRLTMLQMFPQGGLLGSFSKKLCKIKYCFEGSVSNVDLGLFYPNNRCLVLWHFGLVKSLE